MVDNFNLIGGSMSDVKQENGYIKKSYSGALKRGHEKLLKEQLWFDLLPTKIYKRKNRIFPKSKMVLPEKSDETALWIEPINKSTISKLIMSGSLSPKEATSWYEASQDVLFSDVYPLRTAISHEEDVFLEYHEKRLLWATQAFENHPATSSLFKRGKIQINGIPLLGPKSFLKWCLDDWKKDALKTSKFFAIHGNLHFDNILVPNSGRPLKDEITFIDPRGDLIGPLYYDSGKLFTTAHSHYDEIHYNHYQLTEENHSNYILSISNRFEQHYHELQQRIFKRLEQYAKFQEEHYDRVLISTILCEAIHTYSFAAYHLNRVTPDIKRVKAYLLISTLLRKKIDDFKTKRSFHSYYDKRLFSSF